MPRFDRLNAYLLVIVAAILGYLLVSTAPRLIDHYDSAAAQGPVVMWSYLVSVGIGVFLLGGSGLWLVWQIWRATRQKQRRRKIAELTANQMSAAQKQQTIQEKLDEAKSLASEGSLSATASDTIGHAVAEMQNKLQSQSLQIVAFGTISSGKSALLNALAGRQMFRTEVVGGTTVARNEIQWPAADKVILVDTPGLSEVHGHEREAVARQAAQAADLILFVVDGPLKDFEHEPLKLLAQMDKRILVCLNKEDWYPPRDREALVQQLAEQVADLVRREDVVAVRAGPATKMRVRVAPDGTEEREAVKLEPDISQLAQRMMAIVKTDGRDILLANLLLQSRALVADVKQQLEGHLREQAEKLVDKYTWQAGAAAALSPVPVLDIAVALALSAKMVFQLARLYRQPIDISAAGRLAEGMGKNLLTILGTTAITPAISAVASAIKAVPGIGTIAGGIVQGLVQALVTRWIGGVFIQYFESEMKAPEGGLAALAKDQWGKLTSPEQLARLAAAGLKRLQSKDSP